MDAIRLGRLRTDGQAAQSRSSDELSDCVCRIEFCRMNRGRIDFNCSSAHSLRLFSVLKKIAFWMKRIISDELQAALRCLVIAWRLFTEEPLHEEDTTDYDSQK